MHWLIPFASGLPSDAAPVLQDADLPNLARLLRRLALAARDDGDLQSLSTPHERAWAAGAGWQAADGLLPFAAHAAVADGIDAAGSAWGLVTPCHWVVGRTQVSMADPAELRLTPDESRSAFDASRELFDDAGLRLVWAAPDRWYAQGDALAELPCASLDRVIGRDVESWLRRSSSGSATGLGRRLRRLQSEFQMQLYPHPMNEAREERGAPPLNSFWLSGCGRLQPVAGDPPTVDDRLRRPLLTNDLAAWTDAWRALDAGPIAEARQAADDGLPVAVTLCGERNAHRFETAPRSAWQRLASSFGLGGQAPTPLRALEAL